MSIMVCEASVDAVLEGCDGRVRPLRALRGRVVVLFWEAREHLEQNAALKRELESVVRDRAREVVLLGVGDVRALDLPVIRPIVRRAIADMARSIGHEILLDWRGALERPPLSLRRGRSNVLVLDHEGRPVLRRMGALSPAARAEVVETVLALGARALAA